MIHHHSPIDISPNNIHFSKSCQLNLPSKIIIQIISYYFNLCGIEDDFIFYYLLFPRKLKGMLIENFLLSCIYFYSYYNYNAYCIFVFLHTYCILL